MMLDHLQLPAAAARIRRAVERTLADGHKRPTWAASLRRSEMGAAVVERLAGLNSEGRRARSTRSDNGSCYWASPWLALSS